uniref:Cell wall integrity and stress response component 4-like n=1 Tax=Crassostrea virginica TaxID=6565 RepID=A0A8B8BPK8_CRAVI|nr:cell wall integrity and stress response component 4-like [Crassostrea virginica]
MCEVAFSDGVAENLCEPTTMTPKETHVNIPQKTTITETSSFYSDITPDYASTDSSTSLLRFSTEKRHNLLTADLTSVTISTDVRKTDYSPDASTQKQTTHKKLSPDLKTSVSSTTPSPFTHGDTTFSSPISHGGDTFNSTLPSPSSSTIPEATSNSTRDTTLSVDEDSDKVNEAYRLGVAAVALAVLLLAGWILKMILKRFGMKCRLPVTGSLLREPACACRRRGNAEATSRWRRGCPRGSRPIRTMRPTSHPMP